LRHNLVYPRPYSCRGTRLAHGSTARLAGLWPVYARRSFNVSVPRGGRESRASNNCPPHNGAPSTPHAEHIFARCSAAATRLVFLEVAEFPTTRCSKLTATGPWFSTLWRGPS
jgi:hypothetical protein